MTRATPRTLFFTLCLGVLLAGCPDPEPNPATVEPIETFKRALPTEALLSVLLPNGDEITAALSDYDTEQGALVGQTAWFYDFTKTTSTAVNQGLLNVLQPLAWVVKNVEPVQVTENKAVWAFPDAEILSVLVIQRKDDGHFEYVNAWRPVNEPQTEFTPIIAGTFTPAGNGRGQGAIWMNLDNNRNPNNTGKVLALYSNAGPERTVTVYYFDFSTDLAAGVPTSDLAYHFQMAEDRSGTFVYAIQGVDIDQGAPGKEALEDATVISRWDAQGRGRSDWFATGGDVAKQAFQVYIASQCWAPKTHISTYEASWVRYINQSDIIPVSEAGDLSSCPHSDVAKPVLPDSIAAPEDVAVPYID